MGLGTVVRTLLLGDATVAGLIGTRVYPVTIPQNPVFPVITYQRISRLDVASQDGPSALARGRIQVDVWAKTYDQAAAVGAAVRRRLNGYRGPVEGQEDVQGIRLETNRDEYDPEALLFRHSADFYVWHEEN